MSKRELILQIKKAEEAFAKIQKFYGHICELDGKDECLGCFMDEYFKHRDELSK